MAWIDAWVARRREQLNVRRDDAGNYLILRKDRSSKAAPILVTAHLDHPAFVVVAPSAKLSRNELELEFRGGVHDPYFVGTSIEVIDCHGNRHEAKITNLDSAAQPFKRVRAKLQSAAAPLTIAPGDIGRWLLPPPRVSTRSLEQGSATTDLRLIETHACDDLAAVAAACAAFDRLLNDRSAKNLGLLFTVAEEVGFIGAIHAARGKFIPKNSRLLCLENSRSFPSDSPIGAGAILRVGDRISVFTPSLTNALANLYQAHAKAVPTFRWQRKLMAGGACEATAFAAYGFESTCLCLALGNYHNMTEIDATVAAAKRNPKTRGTIGPEFVSVDDFHGLVEMLLVGVRGLAATDASPSKRTPQHRALMESIYAKSSVVLEG